MLYVAGRCAVMMWRSKSYLLVKALLTVGVCLKALLSVLGAKLRFRLIAHLFLTAWKTLGNLTATQKEQKAKKKLFNSKSPLKYKGLVSAPNPQLPAVFSIISAPTKMMVFFRAFRPMCDLCFLLCLDMHLMNCWDGHNRIGWFLYLTPYSLLKESFKTQQVS